MDTKKLTDRQNDYWQIRKLILGTYSLDELSLLLDKINYFAYWYSETNGIDDMQVQLLDYHEKQVEAVNRGKKISWWKRFIKTFE